MLTADGNVKGIGGEGWRKRKDSQTVNDMV